VGQQVVLLRDALALGVAALGLNLDLPQHAVIPIRQESGVRSQGSEISNPPF
jgi:hypothetical protein